MVVTVEKLLCVTVWEEEEEEKDEEDSPGRETAVFFVDRRSM